MGPDGWGGNKRGGCHQASSYVRIRGGRKIIQDNTRSTTYTNNNVSACEKDAQKTFV